jgi:predicted ATPase
MLTRARIKNFKAWRDTGDVRLAPLTVIFGGNSAGKSSLGHLLLALKQTALLSDRKRALHLGDPTSLIDLGTFVDCLYGHDVNRKLEFSLQWRLSSPLEVKNTLNPSETYKGNELSLDAVLKAGKADQPEIERIRYALIQGNVPQLVVDHVRGASDVTLKAQPLALTKMQGRKWPIDPPEKFYRFADATLARFQNAGFLADFALETERMLNALSYLGPLRSHPERIYPWSGETPQDVGMRGEYAVAALLAAEADGRILNRGHRKRQRPFAQFVAQWMIDLGVIYSFTVKPVAEGRKEYEVLIKTHADAPEVKLTDVGFGISQVLPALVEAFYAPPNSTVWMEQPEIHLHPQVQAHLADAFISAVQAWEGGNPRNVQLIVESHSEHFLSRLQRRVAEGVITPDDVAIYFCKRSGKHAELEPLSLDLYGNIQNWPDNFFGDEMEDVAARTMAAMTRKIAERKSSAA